MALTKAEKAVAVAQDVISQLTKRRNPLRVEDNNGYLITNYTPPSYDGDFQDIIPAMLKSGCVACARGAALISKAALFDKVPLNRILAEKFDKAYAFSIVHQDTTYEFLKDIFSKSTLELIEAAFEISVTHARKCTKLVYGAAVFGANYKRPKQRLIAIMENVIANGGILLVTPATEEEYHEARKKYQ